MSEGGLFGMVEEARKRMKSKKESNNNVIDVKNVEDSKPEFKKGDIVYHKLTGQRYLIDKVKKDKLYVETEESKETVIGSHKVKKREE